MELGPVTLRGRHITLEPLDERHATGLYGRGYQRDTVYYSILDSEWPAVKARLEARLAAPTDSS